MITWLIYHYHEIIFVEPAAIKFSKDDKYTYDCWELAKIFPLQFPSEKNFFTPEKGKKIGNERHCSLITTDIEFDNTMIINNIQMWWHCFPSYKFCDTHNSFTPVIFAIEIYKKVILFKIGYSNDGVFDVITMFNEINWQEMQLKNDQYTVTYSSLPHFYDATYNKENIQDLEQNKYTLPLGFKWSKAQTCESCESQTMQITRTYSEGQTKSQALQTAWSLSISGSASTSVGVPGFGDIGLDLGYGASKKGLTRDTFSDSLNIGTNLVKTISCKTKNIYIYGLSITSWNGKTETIPCDHYYCSNKTNPPICIPKIKGDEINTESAKYCNGDNDENDFKVLMTTHDKEEYKSIKPIKASRALSFHNKYVPNNDKSSQSNNNNNNNIWISFMIFIIFGICICGGIAFIFCVCISSGCLYLESNRKKTTNILELEEESDIIDLV